MDGIIEEMDREILRFRKFNYSANTLERWAKHLRDTVQPQLDELAAMKAGTAAAAPARVPKAGK